jgi:hypothetical protein
VKIQPQWVVTPGKQTNKQHTVLVTTKRGNKYFETVEQYKYFEITLTYKNSSHEGIKAYRSQEMIAIIRCSKFCLSICYPKT